MINLRNKILLFYAAAASTFIAGVLHLVIVPMFPQMPLDITIFFIVSGLAQLFWVIPVIKEWGKIWYYVGIGGTVVLIIMYIVAVPGGGHPVAVFDATIEFFQIVFVILCSIIITKYGVQTNKKVVR